MVCVVTVHRFLSVGYCRPGIEPSCMRTRTVQRRTGRSTRTRTKRQTRCAPAMTSGDKVVLCCPRFEILGKLHTRESGQVRKVRAKTSKDLLLVVLVIQSAASQAQPLSHPSVLLQLVDVIAMTSFGSLVFCNDCGNLLDASTGVKQVTLKCNVCGTTCKGKISGASSLIRPV